jgi:hypothetical protein
MDEQPTLNTRGKPFVTTHRFGPSGKCAIVAVAERDGNVRSFRVDRATTIARMIKRRMMPIAVSMCPPVQHRTRAKRASAKWKSYMKKARRIGGLSGHKAVF